MKHPTLCPYVLAIWGILVYFIDSKDIVNRKGFGVCLAAVLLFMLLSVPFQNMIKNGGFEENDFAWTFYRSPYPIRSGIYGLSNVSFGIEPVERNSGGKSLKIVNKQERGDEKYGAAYQPIKLNPNRSYAVSFFVKGKIHNRTLWVSIRDDWGMDEGSYEVPAEYYKEWKRIAPEKRLFIKEGNYADFKIISEAPGDFYIDDISLKWDPVDTIKRYLIKWYQRTRELLNPPIKTKSGGNESDALSK